MSKKILSEAKCRFKGNKNDKNDYVFILEEPRNSIYKYTILALDKDKFINCIKEKANLYENNTSEGVTIPDYLVELRTTYHDTQKQSVKDLNLSSGIITVTDKGISIDPKYFSEHDDDSKKEFFKKSPDEWIKLKEDKLKDILIKIYKKSKKKGEKTNKRIASKNAKAEEKTKKNMKEQIKSVAEQIRDIVINLNKSVGNYNKMSKGIDRLFGASGGEKFREFFKNKFGINFEEVKLTPTIPDDKNMDIKSSLDKDTMKVLINDIYVAEHPSERETTTSE